MLRVANAPMEGQRKPMGKEPTRVVLADDHDVVRQGLKRLLDRAPEIEVVGEASDGLEALKSVKELQPDVLLLDIEMPVMDGIEVARRLQEANMKVRILVLSAYDDHEYIRALLDIGVSGYLVKGEAPVKIIEAIRGIAQDQQKAWVSPQVRKKLEKMNDPAFKPNALSHRDLDILRLVAAGKPEKNIARQVNVSEEELADILKSLMQKVGASSLDDLVKISVREGWIPPSEGRPGR